MNDDQPRGDDKQPDQFQFHPTDFVSDNLSRAGAGGRVASRGTAINEKDSFYGQDTPYADTTSKMHDTNGGETNPTGAQNSHSLYDSKSRTGQDLSKDGPDEE